MRILLESEPSLIYMDIVVMITVVRVMLQVLFLEAWLNYYNGFCHGGIFGLLPYDSQWLDAFLTSGYEFGCTGRISSNGCRGVEAFQVEDRIQWLRRYVPGGLSLNII